MGLCWKVKRLKLTRLLFDLEELDDEDEDELPQDDEGRRDTTRPPVGSFFDRSVGDILLGACGINGTLGLGAYIIAFAGFTKKEIFAAIFREWRWFALS
jgi:hypothetical protein